MGLYVNASVSMPTEMVEKIDAHSGSWSRARYIRWCIRNAEGTPFDPDEEDVPDFESDDSDGDSNDDSEEVAVEVETGGVA